MTPLRRHRLFFNAVSDGVLAGSSHFVNALAQRLAVLVLCDFRVFGNGIKVLPDQFGARVRSRFQLFLRRFEMLQRMIDALACFVVFGMGRLMQFVMKRRQVLFQR